MSPDVAVREELWAVSLAFHRPLHNGGSRVQAGGPESVPAVPILSSTREGSGALHKTHCGRLRLFPGTPGSPFLSGLWKRSWDEAVIFTMMKDPDRLTDRQAFLWGFGRSLVSEWDRGAEGSSLTGLMIRRNPGARFEARDSLFPSPCPVTVQRERKAAALIP